MKNSDKALIYSMVEDAMKKKEEPIADNPAEALWITLLGFGFIMILVSVCTFLVVSLMDVFRYNFMLGLFLLGCLVTIVSICGMRYLSD